VDKTVLNILVCGANCISKWICKGKKSSVWGFEKRINAIKSLRTPKSHESQSIRRFGWEKKAKRNMQLDKQS
jgi:hypothetical protein